MKVVGTYDLTGLTAAQMAFLYDVLSHVSGDVKTSRRRHADSLLGAIAAAGLSTGQGSTSDFDGYIIVKDSTR